MPSVPAHRVVSRVSRQLVVKQQPSANLSDSTIMIRMQAAGVCGTDLAMLSGTRLCHAEVLGHEGVGVVVSAPENCGVQKGARVILNPVHRTQPDVVIGHSRDGIFREIFWLDASEASQGSLLVECPKQCSLADAELALAEPLASVLYSIELLRKKRNATSLLIRGSGTIAILAAKVWSTIEGSSAVLVSKSETHAQWLRQAIDWPGNVKVWSLETKQGSGASAHVDSAILCCSREDAPAGLHFLMDTIQDNATIDLMAGFPPEYKEPRLAGVGMDRIRWNNICGVQSGPFTTVVDQNTRKILDLVGHRGTSEKHILQAVELLSRRAVSLTDVPHRQITLEELPATVGEMLSPARHSTNWIKAIVAFPKEAFGEKNGQS